MPACIKERAANTPPTPPPPPVFTLLQPAKHRRSAASQLNVAQVPFYFFIPRSAPAKAGILVALKWKTCCASVASKLDAAAECTAIILILRAFFFFFRCKTWAACLLFSPAVFLLLLVSYMLFHLLGFNLENVKLHLWDNVNGISAGGLSVGMSFFFLFLPVRTSVTPRM